MRVTVREIIEAAKERLLAEVHPGVLERGILDTDMMSDESMVSVMKALLSDLTGKCGVCDPKRRSE